MFMKLRQHHTEMVVDLMAANVARMVNKKMSKNSLGEDMRMEELLYINSLLENFSLGVKALKRHVPLGKS